MAAGLGAVHYRTGGASHPDTACAKPAGMNRKSDQDPPDDPVAEAILALLAEQAPGRSVSPEEAARAFVAARARPGDPPGLWRRYLRAARQQAHNLARQRRIVILRKGKAVDPEGPVKGVIRLALPEN
ncbi:MAG: DUF3253 domain-containing protein [Kiloniellales bacterium]